MVRIIGYSDSSIPSHSPSPSPSPSLTDISSRSKSSNSNSINNSSRTHSLCNPHTLYEAIRKDQAIGCIFEFDNRGNLISFKYPT
jgi:hypothetical protein